MLNYAGCCKCQSRGFLGEEGRVRSVGGGEGMEGDSGNEGDGEEEEETISFKRKHIIATVRIKNHTSSWCLQQHTWSFHSLQRRNTELVLRIP